MKLLGGGSTAVNVVAVKSKACLTFFIVLIFVFFLVAALTGVGFLLEDVSLGFLCAFMTLMIFGCSIYYGIMVFNLPSVLITQDEAGYLILHESKSVSVRIRPEDILFIGQKNYTGRGIRYSFGKLIIETSVRIITVRWVAAADDVRRALEYLRDQAKARTPNVPYAARKY